MNSIRSLCTLHVGMMLAVFFTLIAGLADGEEQTAKSPPDALANEIRKASPNILSDAARDRARSQFSQSLRSGLQDANEYSNTIWKSDLSGKDDESRHKAFEESTRLSLGLMRINLLVPKEGTLTIWPDRPDEIETHVTTTIAGDGFFIDNIVFQSRPGWWVTANLYRPAEPTKNMPGIIISHSHHRPKEHGELQDMGMTWARAGCVVLVPDHMGHGERAQHGFHSADDFPREFRVSRQDYYFRYDSSIQLYLAGESLMGWMAWDLMRGVDVLLQHEGVDEEKIIMLGAVAGGGDPCAVTAALDKRIDCAVPFNFGGPQPETRYPLPEDIETSFNYVGSGSWESTRNLIGSADGDFLPWMIVGSIAPRKLIYAHEFNWHRERDPVWKRLEKIYELHDARDNLAFTHGRGELRGNSPEATHCTHIGKFHRVKIHEALKRWYGITAEEYSNRRESRELQCWTDELRAKLKPQMLHELLAEQAARRLDETRESLAKRTPKQRRKEIIREWGFDNEIAEYESHIESETDLAGGAKLLRMRMSIDEADEEREVPMLLLLPKRRGDEKSPLVMAAAQQGKGAFLTERADEIAKLLKAGVAVGLPDVVGVGEMRLGDGRTRTSGDTSRAATALMLDRTLLFEREDDFFIATLTVMDHPAIDRKRVAFWGESFAPLNPRDGTIVVPRGIGGRPHQVEPLGTLLALMGGIRYGSPVYIHRGLASYEDALSSPYVYLPLDAIRPPMFFSGGDIADMAAAHSPRPLRLASPVDAAQRKLSQDDADKAFDVTSKQYQQDKAADHVSIVTMDESPAAWLIEQLQGE